MIRTKLPQKKPFDYNKNEEPIILSKHLMDILLKEQNFSELLALYSFYYYTAKWQDTTQPRATLSYVQKGMHWGKDKIQITKKRLHELGLIHNIITRNSTGKINGNFIKINILWSKNQEPENTASGKTTGSRVLPLAVNSGDKCLKPNRNINALNPNNLSVPTQKISLKEKNEEYFPLAEKLSTIIQTKKKVNISQTKINAWANDVRMMVETDGIEYVRIRKALKWYATNIGGKYIPVIESGGSLREKFLKLENAIERENDSSYVTKKRISNGTLRNGEQTTLKIRKADLIIH